MAVWILHVTVLISDYIVTPACSSFFSHINVSSRNPDVSESKCAVAECINTCFDVKTYSARNVSDYSIVIQITCRIIPL
jgi:hypothetical protein